MKSYEKEFLFKKKVIQEGKQEDLANYEIEQDEAFNRNIKYDFKRLTKERDQLKKEVDRLNKLLNKRLVPDDKVKVIETKKIKYLDRSCSVKYLYRIIKFIEDNPKSRITNIKDGCIFPNNELIKEGLNFLVKYKLINESKDKGVTLYECK